MAKTKKQKAADKKLLKKIRERFTAMTEADDRNRQAAMEDMKFANVPGYQWDENMKIERGDRPCYEFNKLRITCKRIINEMRANRPQGKVRGTEDSDVETAEIYEGLIRNIWNVSDGDTIIDTAAEYQVSAGMGAWRVVTKYVDESSFDDVQDIEIEEIHNPFCLYSDPSAKDQLKRDANDWILTEKISKLSFEEKYGDIEVVEWESTSFDDDEEWSDDDDVRVAEYWWKEPVQKEIWQLDDGKVIDSKSDEAALTPQETIKKRRIIDTHQIKMCIATGDAILEGPTEWAGKLFPFVVVYGEYMVIDGRIEWFGIPRFAKDAQKSYNISRTAIAETVAGTPLSTIWATAKQAEGHTGKWAEAHQKNFPFKLYNPDPLSPGPPQRTGGAEVPIALINESNMASEDIKAVTGIFSADQGAPNAASSGRQEIARQQQGQLATFNYPDNLAKGIRRTWEILVDLIPNIYDTERSLRVLGNDDAEDYVRINTFELDPETGEQIKVHDLSEGRYDVAITVGPGFSTKRQEASETYMGLTQGNPAIMQLAGDLIFKSMDLPYADDIADRLKVMLPPEIQQMLNKDANVPPEVQAMMAQADKAMQEVQGMAQEVQQAALDADKEKSLNDKDKAEIRTMIANLKTEEAKFEAKIAKKLANLAEKDMGLQKAEMQINNNVDAIEGRLQDKQAHEQAMAEAAQSMNAIGQMSEQFMQYAVGLMNDIEQKAESFKDKPKVIRIDLVRKNGTRSAIPVYEEPDQEAPGQNIEETRE